MGHLTWTLDTIPKRSNMYLLFTFLGFFALNPASACQIPHSFKTHKRQTGPDDVDLKVNIHPEAANALSAFLKLNTSLDSCNYDGPKLPDQGIPDIPFQEIADVPLDTGASTPPSKRQQQLKLSGPRAYNCLLGTGKAAVAAVSSGHILEPLVKFVKDIQVNIDIIIYKDPDIEKASNEFMLFGANALTSAFPQLGFDNANKILQAIFSAEYARIMDQVENLSFFQVASRLLERQRDSDTCPTTTTGTIGKLPISLTRFSNIPKV